MPDPYIEFFLNAKSELIQFECIEVSHPDFSQVYRFVRNNTDGLTVTLETSEEVTFDYVPIKISQNEMVDDLDYGFKLELGDVGEILPLELDLVAAAGSFLVKPELKYRTYRSDNLESVMFGPIILEVTELAFNKTGVVFEARAPQLNVTTTGELYTIGRFPGLKDYL
jgi:hypothetical protein